MDYSVEILLNSSGRFDIPRAAESFVNRLLIAKENGDRVFVENSVHGDSLVIDMTAVILIRVLKL